jgi:transcriptional regulator with XRE-family HTH domain
LQKGTYLYVKLIERYNCNMKTFSKRLAWLLTHEELSRAEFAHKVGISVSSLSHLLSERNLPGMELLMAMCKEFHGLNPSWLLLGQGEAFGLPEMPNSGLFDTKALHVEPMKSLTVEAQEPIQEPNPNPPTQEEPKATEVVGMEASESAAAVSDFTKSDLESDIEYVMVFYRNGKFKKYGPAQG